LFYYPSEIIELKMKNFILSILFLFSGTLLAQQRDLNYYLEQAKNNSPLINKNKNDNKIAELDLKQIRSILYKPEINLESSVLLAPIVSHDNNSSRFELISNGADKYNGYDLASTDGGQYQALVNLKQPLFTKSQFNIYSDKNDISHKINENKIVLTIHETEQLVTYQYLICLKSKMQIENSVMLLKVLDDQLQTLQKLVESAIFKQTDYLLLQIERQNYDYDYKCFQAEYKDNLYDLNLICGINDTSLLDIKDVYFQLNPDTIAQSSFLTSYKLDSLNIISDQSINELKYKPQVNFFANAGLNAVYIPTYNRLGFCAGITFSWNIYDGNQKNIEREKSKLNLHTLVFEKNNFLTQQDINKTKILNQIHSLNQRILLAEEQIILYSKLLDVYSKELTQGEMSVMDYKNLLKDITAKKQQSLLMKIEEQQLINSYNYWNF